MASMGLLGALSGVGKALETFGSDIVKRREQALENARLEAQYQRKLADQKAATVDERAFTVSRDTARNTAADARVTRQIEGREKLAKSTQEFKVLDREDQQLAARALAELNGDIDKQLASTNANYRAAAAKLKAEIAAQKPIGLLYGKPDKDGYVEVRGVTASGDTVRMTSRAYRPDKKAAGVIDPHTVGATEEDEDEDEDN